MIDATRTTTQLLADLHDGQDAAWTELDRRYRPILFNFARRLGLAEADAADVAQETLAEFARIHREGRYHRERGRLRMLLVGVAKKKAAAARRRALGGGRGGRLAVLPPELDPPDPAAEAEADRIWEQERRQHLLLEALEELRTSTRTGDAALRAFELIVTRRLAPAAVAESLGMTPHDVHLAKSRCLARLRPIIARLEAAYDEGEP